MSRSIWKGFFIKKSLLKPKNKTLKIWSRSSCIPFNLVNKAVLVHNGKIFKRIFITREKVGFKFGEFCNTRIYNKSKKK